MNELRRVRVYEFDSKMQTLKPKCEAWFHRWSTDHEDYGNLAGLFPVAVVEMDDGKVDVVYAKHIQFLEPYGDAL